MSESMKMKEAFKKGIQDLIEKNKLKEQMKELTKSTNPPELPLPNKLEEGKDTDIIDPLSKN